MSRMQSRSRGSDKSQPLNRATGEMFSYLVCHDEECRLGISDAVRRLNEFTGESVSQKEALNFFKANRERFEVNTVDGQLFIEARTTLKFCDAYQGGKCRAAKCSELHICRYFLQGSCKFEDVCKKPHSFDSPQTKTLLEDHKLNNLPPDALCTLFKKMLNEKIVKHASTASGPECCTFYNKAKDGCKNGDKCQFLHVCEHYVDGDCTFGDSECKRLHNFETSHSRKVLAQHRLGHLRNDREIILVLRNGRQKPSLSRSDSCEDNLAQSLIRLSTGERQPPSQAGLSPPSATSKDDKMEICGFHLRGKCYYGSKCHARHTSLPYEWQYCVNGMNPRRWVSFAPSDNCKIEKEFCDYKESSGKAKSSEARWITIDFQTMTGKMELQHGHKPAVLVTTRRLSTVSSVNAATGHVFRTRWRWHWKDENDEWQSYDDGYAETSSDKIEQEYQSETGERKHEFSTATNKYTLHLDDATKLYQQNHKYGTKREVRRRPAQFLDEKAMKQMLEEFKRNRQRTSNSSSETASSIPPHWTPVDPSEEFKRVDLSEVLRHDEFMKVKTQFLAAMPDYTVKSITRVQNLGLWEDYERQKSKITKKNPGNPPKEQWLFHGTNKDTVDPICQQGFDWRLSGSKHGARYGRGSYFATDPSYSHNYSAPSGTGVLVLPGLSNVSKTETFRMFLAKVIVGSSTVGSYETQRPPSKDSSDPLSPLYDSCVNDVNNPTIFVVFERSQAYPYYIIDYARK